MALTRIVILGGGFGGMFTARELKKLLGTRAEIELINDTNYFVFQPLLPEVAAGSITAMHAVTSFRQLLPGVKTRQARVSSVDKDRKVVTVFQGVQRRPTEVPYDHLVVAMGQGSDLSRTPGLTDHALTMKTLDDARRLRSHVLEKLEHADITSLPEVKSEALTFCVIGAGFSGVETVGEMADLIERSLKYYPNVTRNEVRIVLIEFADRILQEMPETLADYALAHLERRGVEVLLGTGVASATGTSLETTKGDLIGTRTIVATIGNAPTKVVGDLDVAHQHGRIQVARTLQVEGEEDIWALGDCALIPMKEGATDRTDFAPPTAQFAVREAAHLAQNIQQALKNAPLMPFAYESKGSLASLGARRGVADIMGLRLKGWPAWVMWRFYYLGILPGLWTRARVLFNWLVDGFSRSVVQVKTYQPPATRIVHYRKGDRVFEAGNRADGVYTVLKGRMEIETLHDGTGEMIRRSIGPGEHFGARVILGRTQRSGTVRAAEDSEVMVLDRDTFIALVKGFPAMGLHMQDHLRTVYGLEWSPEGWSEDRIAAE